MGYLICNRTHRSVGYCGTAVTELTEVLCRVKTEGNYPRYRSVGTLQNLSVEGSTVHGLPTTAGDSPTFKEKVLGFGQKTESEK